MNSPAFDSGTLPNPYSVKNPGSIKWVNSNCSFR